MPALDATRRVFHPIENTFIPIPDNVQFIAAVNRGREFSGTFGIDAAQLDRFAPLQMTYPPPVAERDILGRRHPNVSATNLEIIVAVADAIRGAFTPFGRELPSLGFLVSPDHKRGYSIMSSGIGGNRETEFWYWDLVNHKVIRKEPFETRPTFKFGMSGDGKKLYLYGAGSTLEVFDAETLKSRKLIFLMSAWTESAVNL